ncbi:MAG: hypothetical protein IPM37_08115 [Hahellaceae bacterium]|nr:hypothetical protein [Hahellaceae bacterium]
MNLDEQLALLNDRSDYARDVLGRMPAWLVQHGSLLVAAMVTLMLTLAWLLRYPDVIPAPLTLTTELPPLRVVASVAGELEILVTEADVNAQQPVALIHNTVSWQAARQLREWLNSLNSEQSLLTLTAKAPTLELGELQPTFNAFIEPLDGWRFLQTASAGPRRLEAIRAQRTHLTDLLDEQTAELPALSEQRKLAKASLTRLESLSARQLVSREALETRQSEYLAFSNAEKRQYSLIARTRVDLAELEREEINVELAHQERLQQARTRLTTAYQQLSSALQSWEHRYLLRAPVAGRLSWSRFWSTHQHIKAGEEVFTVIAATTQHVFGRVALPMQNSGKVESGQTVQVKLDSFPYTEYGMLTGTVDHIALAPDQDHYDIIVRLPNPLITSFHKTLPFRQEMQGTAEIITRDRRLLERLYASLWNRLKPNES